MIFIVLSSDNCHSCTILKRVLVDLGLNWEIKYKDSRFHANDPEIFELLNITSVPTIVEELWFNEYKIQATGFKDCVAFAKEIKNLSTPIPELNEIYPSEVMEAE